MIQATKKIIINGGKQKVTEDYQLICKRSRAGKNGKKVKCPHCGHVHRIYRLSFTTLTCPSCKEQTDKYEWMIDQTDTWRTPK
jgi:predicted Zn finger-like uncharacterized protein